MNKLFSNALLCAYRIVLYLPLPLLFGNFLMDGDQLNPALYYAAGQVLAMLLALIPAKRRVPGMLLGVLLYAACGIFWLGALANPLVLVIIALCALGYFMTAHIEGKQTVGRYDTREMIAGIAIHCIIPVVIQLSGIAMEYAPCMWAGVAFFMMVPFVLNDFSVREGMSLRGRGGKPLKRLSNANRVMVSGFMAIALIIANLGELQKAAQRAGSFIMYWIGELILWLGNLLSSNTESGADNGGNSGDMGLGLEAGEPNWFAKFMEQAIQYLVIVILAATAVFVLYKLYKLIRKAIRHISEWAKRFAQGVKEDYMEEREQLMDWGDVRGEMIDSIKERIKKLTTREKKWGDMDARERVRYVMRGLYRKQGLGVSGIEYMSARQALDEMGLSEGVKQEMGELYDRARYSDYEITEAQAEKVRQTAK